MHNHYFLADAICNCPKPSNLDYVDQTGNHYDGKFKIQILTVHILQKVLCIKIKLIQQSFTVLFF